MGLNQIKIFNSISNQIILFIYTYKCDANKKKKDSINFSSFVCQQTFQNTRGNAQILRKKRTNVQLKMKIIAQGNEST